MGKKRKTPPMGDTHQNTTDQNSKETQKGDEVKGPTSDQQSKPSPEAQDNEKPAIVEASKDRLLWKAVITGKIEDIRCLRLEQGADVNATFEYGWTPLLTAVQMTREDIVHFLLEQGADPLHKKANGCTCFIMAGILGNKNLLKLFLSKGADINEMDDNGFTALMEAALYGHEQAVKFLLDEKADVNVERRATDGGKSKSGGGQTALMDAAKKGNESILRMLIDKGASVNHRDLHGRSALLHALCSPEPTIDCVINILLDSGAEVNIRDRNGKTALFLAAEMRRPSLVKVLLEKDGIEVDILDHKGWSALLMAVKQNDYETAKLLLGSGANPNHGNLVLEALPKYNPPLVELLLQHGAMVDGNEIPTHWTPVSNHWGEKLRKLHEMKHPLKGKLKIFIKDEYKIHATSGVGVYVGIYDGHEVAVKITLKEGANQKFLQEQRCLDHLQGSSHSMKLRGTEEDNSRLYLCLMLCEKNLEEHLSSCSVAAESKDILRNLFRALEELHHVGFTHQDVRPSNILIDSKGKYYLADFDRSQKLNDIPPNAKRELIKGDMKGLANLVLYVVTGGKAKCGLEEQDVAELCPDTVTDLVEARDLIRKLLMPDDKHRAVKDFFKHPFFWDSTSRCRFLQDTGNESEIKISKKCGIVTQLNCARGTDGKSFQHWTSQIEPEVMDFMNAFYIKKKIPYWYDDTVTSLLKFIRNMGAHYQETKPNIQRAIRGPDTYFLKKFPDLTLYTYEIVQRFEQKKRLLEPHGFSL